MSTRNLSPLRTAKSVAVIGGSGPKHGIGGIVLDNILAGGFPGTIYAVNPHTVERPGVSWFSRVADLPEAPDLAVVATPAEAVPAVVRDLGQKGCRCAVVITAGLSQANGLKQEMVDAARQHGLRLIGPNCIGFAAPGLKLNATFAQTCPIAGGLALISQSGALVTAVLDWAATRQVGFSGIASLGDMADVDLGDLLDFYATDSATKAILLYVEGVTDAAKFLSAAAAAARVKPVIAIKAGKSSVGAKAVLSHTGALAGHYDVYRAAFERSGIVLVETLTELFDAAEVLCTSKEPAGNRLAIVTNGGGAGILAVDALAQAGGVLAALAPETTAALDAALPATWSHGNPVDLVGDAPPGRYRDAISAMLRDDGVDALLVMNCPTGLEDSAAIADALAAELELARGERRAKPVLACWLGDANAAHVRARLSAAATPVYTTPDDAVRAFGYLLASRRARLSLTDAPAETREVRGDADAARRVIAAARSAHRESLSQIECHELLKAYGVPVTPSAFAPDVDAVGRACAALTAPYAVKISSPDIAHKSEAGGVALGLANAKEAAAAAAEMQSRIRRERPDTRIDGYVIEQMASPPHAREVIVGIATDPTFGPILLAGTGGKAVEIIADKAIALPPIDHAQALELIDRTRISRLLRSYRDVPMADMQSVAYTLDALSAMVVDLPDIIELDINPLLVGPEGAVVLDARARISPAPATSRLAIRPAPMEWAATLHPLNGEAVYVRPVRADDETLLKAFFDKVSARDLHFRFLCSVSQVDHDRLALMTRVDYRRTITFLVFDETRTEVLAAAMLAADADRAHAEVALTTRSDVKGKGVSWVLFEHVLRYAKAEGIERVEAIECADHDAAIRMEREMGFTAVADPDDPSMRIVRRSLLDARSEPPPT